MTQWQAFCDFFDSQLNPLRCLFKQGDFWFHAKRLIIWLSIALLCAAVWLGYLDSETIQSALNFSTAEILGLSLFMYAFEPLLTITTFLLAKYQSSQPGKDVQRTDLASGGKRVDKQPKTLAVVIPAYRSEAEIEDTLSALQAAGFTPDQIFVIANGPSQTPLDHTLQMAKQLCNPQSIWVPIGSKTMAQYVGTKLAQRAGYQYVLTIDDDVLVPKDFNVSLTSMKEGKLKGLCLLANPIQTATEKSSTQSNALIQWARIEYLMSGLNKIFQSQFGGTAFPHGAGSIWEIEAFLDILNHHDGLFFAEDVKLGMIARQLGYPVGTHAGTALMTLAPYNLLFPQPSLYAQRVFSWATGGHFHFRYFLSMLLFVWPWDKEATIAVNLRNLFIIKLTEYYSVHELLVDWSRFALMVLCANVPLFWMLNVTHLLMTGVVAVLWKHFKADANETYQVSWSACLTYPLYRLLNQVLSFISIPYTLLNLWPNNRPSMVVRNLPKSIVELIETHPIRKVAESPVRQDLRGRGFHTQYAPTSQAARPPSDAPPPHSAPTVQAEGPSK